MRTKHGQASVSSPTPIPSNSTPFGSHSRFNGSTSSFSTFTRPRSGSDPLDRALQPPRNESPTAREQRLLREQQAKKRNDEIDEQIRKDKAAMKKQKLAIKILLLGQSESGKSTTLKQFQLLHSPAAFHQERIAWRAVIYLNLIRSIRRILDALLPHTHPHTEHLPSSSSLPSTSHQHYQLQQASRTNHYSDTNDFFGSGGFSSGDTLDTFAYDSAFAGFATNNFTGTNTNNSNFAGMFSKSHYLGTGTGTGTGTYSSSNTGSSSGSGSHPRSVASFAASSSGASGRSGASGGSSGSAGESQAKFEKFAKHLAPLFTLEMRLMRQLSFPDEDDDPATDQPFPPPHAPYLTSLSPSPTLSPSGSQSWSWNTNGNGNHTLTHSLSNSSMNAHSYPPPLNSTLSPISIPSSSSRTAVPLSPTSSTSASTSPHTTPGGELALRPGSTWKQSFSLGGKRTGGLTSRTPKTPHTNEIVGWWDDPDDPCHVMRALCYGEYGMLGLWRDGEVRRSLERRRVRMEESSGFYLDDVERICAEKFIPTDDDVLKARLKTLGVVEHTFTIKVASSDRSAEWKVYDVGGARHQRQAWAPYFEDVNAIIFLAPISAFDQTLAEDPRVNRLEDSMLLWRSVISNKLMSNVNIILFLNKCDLLKTKLESGVSLNYHMPSYGSRPNDYETVSKYFKHKFAALHLAHTPSPEREIWIHLTSVTDKLSTHIIISNVRDLILRENLQNSRLI